jgi:hypothetical protein
VTTSGNTHEPGNYQGEGKCDPGEPEPIETSAHGDSFRVRLQFFAAEEVATAVPGATTKMFRLYKARADPAVSDWTARHLLLGSSVQEIDVAGSTDVDEGEEETPTSSMISEHGRGARARGEYRSIDFSRALLARGG